MPVVLEVQDSRDRRVTPIVMSNTAFVRVEVTVPVSRRSRERSTIQDGLKPPPVLHDGKNIRV